MRGDCGFVAVYVVDCDQEVDAQGNAREAPGVVNEETGLKDNTKKIAFLILIITYV